MLIGHVHTNAGLVNNGIAFYSLTSRGLPFIEVMVESGYTVEEMNVMPTVAYLNEIVFGVGVQSWSGRTLHMTFALIMSLSKGIYREEIFARHVITLFQHDNATSHTARATVNFLRENNIAFVNDWPSKTLSESHVTS